MGNQRSNLNVDDLFEGEMHVQRDQVTRVNVKHHHGTNSLILTGDGKMCDYDEEKHKGLKVNHTFDFEPQSHLRDYEVFDPFTPHEIKIARWAGIGVVVIEAANAYVKMYYDNQNTFRVVFTIWGHGSETKSILNADLSLGYDVMYVTGNMTVKRLCEAKDHRDKAETRIFVPGLNTGLGKRSAPNNESEGTGDESEEQSKTKGRGCTQTRLNESCEGWRGFWLDILDFSQ